MRAALGPGQRDFFSKNHYIEFENLVDNGDDIHAHIDQVLAKRTKKFVETQTPKELFMAGRDLFRDDPILQKASLSRHLGQIASILFNTTPVRIAYDQSLRTTTLTGSPFVQPTSLTQVSCFQPILGGAIIRLSSDPHSPDFLPKKAGSGVFFEPNFVLPWSSFFQTPHQSFLLICYTTEKCRYVLNPEDLHTHALKKLGFGFGDALKNETHPLVFK